MHLVTTSLSVPWFKCGGFVISYVSMRSFFPCMAQRLDKDVIFLLALFLLDWLSDKLSYIRPTLGRLTCLGGNESPLAISPWHSRGIRALSRVWRFQCCISTNLLLELGFQAQTCKMPPASPSGVANSSLQGYVEIMRIDLPHASSCWRLYRPDLFRHHMCFLVCNIFLSDARASTNLFVSSAC